LVGQSVSYVPGLTSMPILGTILYEYTITCIA